MFGKRAFVSAAVCASMALRVGLRLGDGRARLERRFEWRWVRSFAESPSFWRGAAAPAWLLEASDVAKYGEVALSFAGRSLDLKKNEVILVWYSFEPWSCGSESAPILVIVVLRQASASFLRVNTEIIAVMVVLTGLRAWSLPQAKCYMKRTLRLIRSKGDWVGYTRILQLVDVWRA